MLYSRPAALLSAGFILFTACSHRPKPVASTPEPVREATTSPVPARDEAANAREAEARAAAERARTALTARIFFGFDRSDLSPEARAILDTKVPVLRQNPAVTLSIEGHADERGSEEYNLALGMRRAEAARQYLIGYGVDAQQLQSQSMGEDRPLDPGRNEEAWSQNRRAEFQPRGDALPGGN